MKSSLAGGFVFVAAISTVIPLSGQAQAPNLKSVVGQKFLYVGLGGAKDLQIKKTDLRKYGDGCDLAVEIRDVSYSAKVLRFDLEEIGTPEIETKSVGYRPVRTCRESHSKMRLRIKDVGPDDLVASFDAVMNNFLMTPEDYLSYHRNEFDLPAAAIPTAPTSVPASNSNLPKRLLMVEPSYSDEARKAHKQGQVQISMVIGTDGRVQSSKIVKGLGFGLDEQALRAISVWRFDPARQNGIAVPTTLQVTVNFHLY